MSFKSNFYKLTDYISSKLTKAQNTYGDYKAPPIFWVKLDDDNEFFGGMAPLHEIDNPKLESPLKRHNINAGPNKPAAITVSGSLENILFYLLVYVKDFECSNGLFYANLKPIFDTHNMTWSAVDLTLKHLPVVSTVYSHAKKIYSAASGAKNLITKELNRDRDPTERLRYVIGQQFKSRYNSAVIWELRIWGSSYTGDPNNIVINVDGQRLPSFLLCKIIYHRFMDIFCLHRKYKDINFIQTSNVYTYAIPVPKVDTEIEMEDFSQRSAPKPSATPYNKYFKTQNKPAKGKKPKVEEEIELQDMSKRDHIAPNGKDISAKSWEGAKPVAEKFSGSDFIKLKEGTLSGWKLFKVNPVRGVGYLDDAPVLQFGQAWAERFDKANTKFFQEAYQDKKIVKRDHTHNFEAAKQDIWSAPKFENGAG